MSAARPEPRYLRWDFIEKLANNDLSKVIGIIPIAGYLILFNDTLIQSISFDEIAGVSGEESSPFLLSGLTKLRFTFFGSLLVLIANATFKTSAPNILSSSKSDIVFSDQVVSSYSLSEIVEFEADIMCENWTHRTPLLCEDERFLSILNSGVSRSAGYKRKEDFFPQFTEYARAAAREWWVGQMHSKWYARRITLLACILGYGLLAIPTIDIAQAVLRDLFL